DFFQKWADRANLAADHKTHPGAQVRADQLTHRLRQASDRLDYFYVGVRLAQLGYGKDALPLLETFAGQFPSREVLNNLGAVRAQAAWSMLATCDWARLSQMKLPFALDPRSQIDQIRLRGRDDGECLNDPQVRKLLAQAEQSLLES